MTRFHITALLGLALTGPFAGAATATPQVPIQHPVTQGLVAEGAVEVDWVVRSEDHICGVSEARMIASPAKVDYETLMDATPEIKELRRKGIDRESARGQTLVTAARDRVRRATNAVMKEQGYDSVWKRITHRKGTPVADITHSVTSRITS
jgi:hypothetical protein